MKSRIKELLYSMNNKTAIIENIPFTDSNFVEWKVFAAKHSSETTKGWPRRSFSTFEPRGSENKSSLVSTEGTRWYWSSVNGGCENNLEDKKARSEWQKRVRVESLPVNLICKVLKNKSSKVNDMAWWPLSDRMVETVAMLLPWAWDKWRRRKNLTKYKNCSLAGVAMKNTKTMAKRNSRDQRQKILRLCAWTTERNRKASNYECKNFSKGMGFIYVLRSTYPWSMHGVVGFLIPALALLFILEFRILLPFKTRVQFTNEMM